jgi:hypothetical protein
VALVWQKFEKSGNFGKFTWGHHPVVWEKLSHPSEVCEEVLAPHTSVLSTTSDQSGAKRSSTEDNPWITRGKAGRLLRVIHGGHAGIPLRERCMVNHLTSTTYHNNINDPHF